MTEIAEPDKSKELPELVIKYGSRQWQFVSSLLFLVGELFDLMFAVTLFIHGQVLYGCLYFSADILPGAALMMHRFNEEKTWRIWVETYSSVLFWC